MSEPVYAELRSQLDNLKSHQQTYHSQLSNINLTRQQINYQLQELQSSYDRKIKILEQKLQKYQLENEQLVRQNVIFRSEIQHYQNRLVEKEKIIGILINQKGQIVGVNSSDKSKSDKTESNKDNKQDKMFKKGKDGSEEYVPNAMLKTKIQQYRNKDLKSEQYAILQNKKIESAPKIHAPPPPPAKSQKNKVAEPPVVRPAFPAKEHHKPHHLEEQFSHQPSNPADVFAHLQSPPKQSQNQDIQNVHEEPQTSSNVFANLQQQSLQEDNSPKKIAPPPKTKAPAPPPARKAKKGAKPPRKAPMAALNNAFEDEPEEPQQQNSQLLSYFSNSAQDLEDNNINVTNSPNFGQTEETTEQPQPQQAITPAYEEYYHHPNQQNVEENIQEYHYPVHHEQDRQFMTEKKQRQEEQDNNNFLAHFSNNPQEETSYAEMSKPKTMHKKKAAKRPQIKSLQSYPSDKAFEEEQPDPNAFFQQMSRNQEHTMEIEESSIDHIDRDSSYVSNEHNYFNDQPDETYDAVVAKPVKMTKKKAKRGQISAVNPSMFE